MLHTATAHVISTRHEPVGATDSLVGWVPVGAAVPGAQTRARRRMGNRALCGAGRPAEPAPHATCAPLTYSHPPAPPLPSRPPRPARLTTLAQRPYPHPTMM
eukprot:scaffold10020_cov122-Isochrysis_galbana.AAC.12